MIKEREVKKIIAFGIVAILAIIAFFIIRPFILIIVASMVLGYIFYPIYFKLLRLLKSKNITAGLLSLVIIISIVLPLWFLLPVMVRQTFNMYTTLQKIDFVSPLRNIAPKFFSSPEFTRDFIVTVNQVLSKGASALMNNFGEMITNVPMIFMQIIIMLFIFFFTLRDGEKIVSFLKQLSPFSANTEKIFIEKFSNITKAVIYGMFIVGIIQGVATGIGLYVFKVPQPLFLTMFAVLFGIIPIVGPWLVWVPVSVALIIAGNVANGIGLALYGFLVLTWIDFVIRPLFVKKRSGMPHIVALIGMLGGGYLFGIIGFVVGPLILGYLTLFLEFYRTKTLSQLFG